MTIPRKKLWFLAAVTAAGVAGASDTSSGPAWMKATIEKNVLRYTKLVPTSAEPDSPTEGHDEVVRTLMASFAECKLELLQRIGDSEAAYTLMKTMVAVGDLDAPATRVFTVDKVKHYPLTSDFFAVIAPTTQSRPAVSVTVEEHSIYDETETREGNTKMVRVSFNDRQVAEKFAAALREEITKCQQRPKAAK